MENTGSHTLARPNLTLAQIQASNAELAAIPPLVTVTFSIDDALDLVTALASRPAHEEWSNRVVAELVSATGLSLSESVAIVNGPPQDVA